MASGDIVLSAALRNNLLSLKGTQKQIDTTQLRLATGLKVNSALDGPQSFFTAQSLNNRASDLGRLLDGISQSVRTIETANNAVTSLTSLVDQAESIALEAQTELRASAGFTRVRGNEDAASLGTNLVDGTIIAAGQTFTIEAVDGEGVTSGASTITLGAGDTIDDIVAAINGDTALNGDFPAVTGEGVTARVTSSGQLEIQANGEDTSIRIEAGTISSAGLDRIGLGTVAGVEGAGIGGTSISGTQLNSAQSGAAQVNGAFEASATLTAAGFVTAGSSTLALEIDGETVNLNGGVAFATTDTIQDVVDAVNNSGADVEASFNTDTGEIEIEFPSSTGQVALTFGGGGTVGFGFGGNGQSDGVDQAERFTFDGVTTNVDQLEDDYNNVREQINQLVEDASYRGVNLLNGDDLTTFFNEDRSNTLTTDGTDFTALGLGLAEGDFTNAQNIQRSIDQAKDSLESVRRFGSSIANDLAIIQVRQDFTTQTINTLESGADDLTVADANQEGANLLALQTRQQLGVTSLSLASQSEQSVLRLF